MSAESLPMETRRPRLAELRAQQAAPRDTTTIGQLPPNIDLIIYQGDDIFLDVVMADDPLNPVDLTGYTPRSEIRATAGGALLATFTATIKDAHTVGLHLTSVQSTKLGQACVWDVQITDAAGVVTTIAAGRVTVVKQVTQ